ncbi:MAG: hypothetical protein RMJ43_08780 [Chloroherpetonaceae bacterium]|nr:hypothetical protein [Chthonomonadaceae bacterium]MDW8207918.1 hypothetical protein [Chloroherpetonaceae bacterium]
MKLFCVLSVVLFTSVLCPAEAQFYLSVPASPVSATAPLSSLQVSGTSARLSVSASRADVQDVLKAIFDQVDRQFTMDHTVTGMVTLRLSHQPLTVVLNAVCGQTFLRYHVDSRTGVFRFERDEEAVRNAVSRLRALNTLVREQLRAIGLDVPSESVLSGMRGLAGGGVFSRVRPDRDGSVPGARTAPSPGDPVPSGQGADLARPAASGESYHRFLMENSYVGLNTRGQQVPVVDLLQQLARQARVPIVIDPSVPQGRKFRMSANIPPRPLAELLNLLAPHARLEWRWTGQAIFVTAAPEFQFFWGESETPRVSYPASKEPHAPDAPQETLPKRGSPPEDALPLSPAGRD